MMGRYQPQVVLTRLGDGNIHRLPGYELAKVAAPVHQGRSRRFPFDTDGCFGIHTPRQDSVHVPAHPQYSMRVVAHEVVLNERRRHLARAILRRSRRDEYVPDSVPQPFRCNLDHGAPSDMHSICRRHTPHRHSAAF